MKRPAFVTVLFGFLLTAILQSCASPLDQDFNGIPLFDSYAEAGFDAAKIKAAQRCMKSADPVITSVVVIYQGKVLLAWADIEFP